MTGRSRPWSLWETPPALISFGGAKQKGSRSLGDLLERLDDG